MKIVAAMGMLLGVAWTPLALFGQADQQQENRLDRLESRLTQLEQRIDAIEHMLLQQPKWSVSSASSRLADAAQRLQHSQRLFAKGYISRSQLKTDELAVAKAELVLTSAEEGRVDPQALRSIELLEAETKLAVCQDLLRYAQLRASSLDEVEAWEQRVQQARNELKRVQRGDGLEGDPPTESGVPKQKN